MKLSIQRRCSSPENQLIQASLPSRTSLILRPRRKFRLQRARQQVVKLLSDQELAATVSDEQPKFRPFTAAGDVQRRMVGYRRKFPLPNTSSDNDETNNKKVLVVKPVTEEWIAPTSDLLAASFAEALGFGPYKNYLRRQIRKYVQHHMMLPPKAVVLVALLADEDILSSSPSSSLGGAPSASSSYQQNPSAEQQLAPFPTYGLDETQTTLAAAAASIENADQQLMNLSGPQEIDPHASFGDAMGSTWLPGYVSDSIGNPIDLLNDALSSSGSESDGEQSTTGEKINFAALNPTNSKLVGVVELSFAESTRSKYLTLNPPGDRAYLCNMAIDLEYRGQGHGSRLLAAAEELVSVVGETMVYLHLRFQDKPAAGLYNKAGYAVVEEDSVLVRLLGLDRRFLMRKLLP